jgi:thymidylate kinase
MKLLIVEGLDRCGKDTLINSLMETYPNSKMVHWGYPQGRTNEEKTDYQKMSFDFFMKEFSFQNSRNQLDFLIWNRAHIGECVYGPLYRNSDPEWIYNLEKEYLLKDNVYLVYLHGDVEFLLKNDDGESFTTDINKKKREAELFENAVDKSLIKNKLKIKVNNGNEYVDQSGITGTVRYFLNI